MFEIVDPALAREARLVKVVKVLAAKVPVKARLKISVRSNRVLVPEVVNPFPVFVAPAPETEIARCRQPLSGTVLIQAFGIISAWNQELVYRKYIQSTVAIKSVLA